ncbi:MAG: helix-turn-helix domain-containing protein [Clostridia bacterium]|nr:helix-turn-helix domain-containing protein [Clostridia bacterium]
MKEDYLFDISYPSEEEIKAAQLACCGRVCKECETPAAYAWRKREVDMSLLLEKAIENELTENERAVVTDKWYNSLSLTQIARNRGISPAAVKHTSERALEKLEKVLKYVVFYQQDIFEENIVPAVIGRARMIMSARKISGSDIGERVNSMRLGKGLSLKSLSESLGVGEERLEKIEKGDMPETDELILLSGFFAVTTDYILKGEKNV